MYGMFWSAYRAGARIKFLAESRASSRSLQSLCLFFISSAASYLFILVTMSMPSTTANWHWKNKNVTRWAKDWFERELITVTVKGDTEDESVSISDVKEVDGDVELGQRKSKLVCSGFAGSSNRHGILT